MGLTERHWFENEDVPENYEWALEDAVYSSRTDKKANMVEVVRCKDCKNAEPAFDGKLSRCKIRGLRNNDWFCADGKRR